MTIGALKPQLLTIVFVLTQELVALGAERRFNILVRYVSTSTNTAPYSLLKAAPRNAVLMTVGALKPQLLTIVFVLTQELVALGAESRFNLFGRDILASAVEAPYTPLETCPRDTVPMTDRALKFQLLNSFFVLTQEPVAFCLKRRFYIVVTREFSSTVSASTPALKAVPCHTVLMAAGALKPQLLFGVFVLT
jgi:hypothetical protein